MSTPNSSNGISSYNGRGKVAIISGAGSGIGEGIAYALANSGVSLVINGRTKSKLDRVANNIIQQYHTNVAIVVGDISLESTNKELVNTAIHKFGALHIAINNSGTNIRRTIIELQADEIDEQINTNIKGVLFGMKYEIPAIGQYSTPDNEGVIINISSVRSTLVSKNAVSNSVYSGSKSFVDTVTKIAAIEAHEFNVRVNSINPGPVVTDLAINTLGSEDAMHKFSSTWTLKNKAASPHDIASFVLSVIQNPFINGSTLAIDGGGAVAG